MTLCLDVRHAPHSLPQRDCTIWECVRAMRDILTISWAIATVFINLIDRMQRIMLNLHKGRLLFYVQNRSINWSFEFTVCLHYWKGNRQRKMLTLPSYNIQAIKESCSACSGILLNQCVSCSSPDRVIYEGTCTCKNGFFQNSTDKCESFEFDYLDCFYWCKHCQGAGEQKCIDCFDDRGLGNDNKCTC
jgi:hypothetical protein